MQKLVSSASRVVLIALTFTACAALLLRILPVDQFMILAIAVFSYYFAKPNTPDTSTTTTSTTASGSEK